MTEPADGRRRAELAASLSELRSRIELGCRDAGRDPGEVTLVAVTKTFPATDVALLAALGVTDVGENRDQEAAPKHAACAGLPLRWHFVGSLQRNKCRSVAGYADVVHSVDRDGLLEVLGRAATDARREIEALVQVSLDVEAPSSGRGGAAPENVLGLADQIAATEGLTLGGVMAVAPLGEDPDAAFERLSEVVAAVRQRHPRATTVSAGMSGDLEAALRHGATHVRIGTALLGARSVPVG